MLTQCPEMKTRRLRTVAKTHAALVCGLALTFTSGLFAQDAAVSEMKNLIQQEQTELTEKLHSASLLPPVQIRLSGSPGANQ